MLKTLLAIVILATTATAQVPSLTMEVVHPFIKPMPTEAKPVVTQLMPLDIPEWYPTSPSMDNVDKTFWVLTGVWATGVAADIYTTKKAINRGGIESNSFYSRDGGTRAAIGLNIAITTATWGLAFLLQSVGWKWPARVLMSYKAATRWNAAIHNNGVLR